LRARFSLRENDALLIIPITDGNNAGQRFEKFDESDKELWGKQIQLIILRHYYYLMGFDFYSGFILPPGYGHLSTECKEFFRDHPDYSKNIFIMMKFDDKSESLKELDSELRCFLRGKGWNPVRADDKMYLKDRDLWNNVCVYMLCCKQGIAILEKYSAQEFNPNIAVEYGFMRALNRRVLLLADKAFPRERADVVGKERLHFDMESIKSIRSPIEKWLMEIQYSV
jgi:hypothetical protein